MKKTSLFAWSFWLLVMICAIASFIFRIENSAQLGLVHSDAEYLGVRQGFAQKWAI